MTRGCWLCRDLLNKLKRAGGLVAAMSLGVEVDRGPGRGSMISGDLRDYQVHGLNTPYLLYSKF